MCLATCYNKTNVVNTLNVTFLFEYSLEITKIADDEYDAEEIRHRIQREFFNILSEELCQYDSFVSIRSSPSIIDERFIKTCLPEIHQNNNCYEYSQEMNVNYLPSDSIVDIHHYLDLSRATLKEEAMSLNNNIDIIDKIKILNSTIGGSNIMMLSSQTQNANNNNITEFNSFAKEGLFIGVAVVAFISFFGLILKRKTAIKQKRENILVETIQNEGEGGIDFSSIIVEIDDTYKNYQEDVISTTPDIHTCHSETCLACSSSIECTISKPKKSVTFESVDDVVGEI